MGKLSTMSTRELFDFVTDVRIADENEYLTKMQEIIALRPTEKTNEERVMEEVFMKVDCHLHTIYIVYIQFEQTTYSPHSPIADGTRSCSSSNSPVLERHSALQKYKRVKWSSE